MRMADLKPGWKVVGNDGRHVGVAELVGQPLRRILRVQRQPGPARLEHAEFGGRQVEAPVHQYAADGLFPTSRVETVDLAEGHPYLRLPLQFARSLRPRLEQLVPAADLDHLLADSAAEIDRRGTRGVTFTLVQTWAVVP